MSRRPSLDVLFARALDAAKRTPRTRRKPEVKYWYRGSKSSSEGLPAFPAWFTSMPTSAKDYGSHVRRFELVETPALLELDDYGKAMAELGVKKSKNASRDLLIAALSAGYDGYHYRNPSFADEEMALGRPEQFLVELPS